MKKIKSTDDLLDLLDSDEETYSVDVVEFSNDVVSFISKYNIKAGENSVKRNLLYKLYKEYSVSPVEMLKFSTVLGEYLPRFTNSRGAWFKLNIEALKVTKELFTLLNANKRKATTSVPTMNHFKYFRDSCNIHEGDKWIEGFILFEVYKRWNKFREKKPILGYPRFLNMLKANFKHRRITENRSEWFRVTTGYKDYVTEDDIKAIRHNRQRKKKARSIPGIETGKESKDKI